MGSYGQYLALFFVRHAYRQDGLVERTRVLVALASGTLGTEVGYRDGGTRCRYGRGRDARSTLDVHNRVSYIRWVRACLLLKPRSDVVLCGRVRSSYGSTSTSVDNRSKCQQVNLCCIFFLRFCHLLIMAVPFNLPPHNEISDELIIEQLYRLLAILQHNMQVTRRSDASSQTSARGKCLYKKCFARKWF